MKNQTNSPKEPQPKKCDDSGPKLLPMSIINLNKEPKLRYDVKENNIKTLRYPNQTLQMKLIVNSYTVLFHVKFAKKFLSMYTKV